MFVALLEGSSAADSQVVSEHARRAGTMIYCMDIRVRDDESHSWIGLLLLCLQSHEGAFNVVEARFYSCLGLRLGWSVIEQSSIFRVFCNDLEMNKLPS
jgi:hypothetical protein